MQHSNGMSFYSSHAVTLLTALAGAASPSPSPPPPSVLPPPPSSGCTQTYTVVSGDYCDKIRLAFGITLAQLQAFNPTMNCATLQPGQVLCVAQGEG